MGKRAHISLATKLACCLAEIQALRGDPFDFQHLKQMTAADVVSLYNFDHAILHAVAPIDEHWNLTPRLIRPHRLKTTNDRRELRKNKRAGERQAEHRSRLARKYGQIEVAGGMDGGEPSPKPRRPMPGSRASPYKRHLDGRVTRR